MTLLQATTGTCQNQQPHRDSVPFLTRIDDGVARLGGWCVLGGGCVLAVDPGDHGLCARVRGGTGLITLPTRCSRAGWVVGLSNRSVTRPHAPSAAPAKHPARCSGFSAAPRRASQSLPVQHARVRARNPTRAPRVTGGIHPDLQKHSTLPEQAQSLSVWPSDGVSSRQAPATTAPRPCDTQRRWTQRVEGVRVSSRGDPGSNEAQPVQVAAEAPPELSGVTPSPLFWSLERVKTDWHTWLGFTRPVTDAATFRVVRTAIVSALQARTMQSIKSPHAWDIVALCRAYPLQHGEEAVVSNLHHEQFAERHWATCQFCGPHRAPRRSCVIAKLVECIRCGWAPHVTRQPPASAASPYPVSEGHAGVLQEDWHTQLRAGTLARVPAGSTVQQAAPRFVVEQVKHSYTQDRGHWVLDEDVRNKQRVVVDYTRAVRHARVKLGVNAVCTRWPLALPAFTHFWSPLAHWARRGWIDPSDSQVHVAVLDFSGWYTQLPVARRSRAMLCMTQRTPHGVEFAVPTRVPFGLAPAAAYASAISSLINRWTNQAVRKQGLRAVSRSYIDDHLILAASKNECERAMKTFTNLCSTLGINVAAHKTVKPTQHAEFLGMTVDTRRLCFQPKPHHVADAQFQLRTMLTRRGQAVTLKQWRVLVGKLQFLAQAQPAAKYRLTSLYAAGNSLRKGDVGAPWVVEDVVEDMRWWLQHCAHIKPTRIHFQSTASFVGFVSDAGARAVAAHTAKDFAWQELSQEMQAASSTAREIQAVLVALVELFGDVRDAVITAVVDNAAATLLINARQPSPSAADRRLLRRLLLQLAAWQQEHNTVLIAFHAHRRCVALADALTAADSLMDARRVFAHALRRFGSARAATTRASRAAPPASGQSL